MNYISKMENEGYGHIDLVTIDIILFKLDIKDKRGIANILLNKELVERILKDDVISIPNAQKKYSLSYGNIAKLISENLLSFFCNNVNKGSPKYIFEEELKIHLFSGFVYVNNNLYLKNVERNNFLIVSIAQNCLDAKRLELIKLILINKKSLSEIQTLLGLTSSRIYLLLHDSYEKISHYSSQLKSLAELEEFKSKLKKLKESFDNEQSIIGQDFCDIITELDKKHISSCGFSTRTFKTLKYLGINTVANLLAYDLHDYENQKNIGLKSLTEIIEFCSDNNYIIGSLKELPK